jgi:hypothetical protein
MKPWLLIILGVALPAIAGCRTDPAIPLLERELYRKDKEINRLKWQLEDMQDMLNSSPDRPIRDKTSDERAPETDSRRGRHGSVSNSGSGGNGGGDVAPPTMERGTPTNKVPDALKAPTGSLPPDIPDVPESISRPSSNKSSDDGPALDGGISASPIGLSTGAVATTAAIPFNPSGNSSKVAKIQLDKMLTCGINSGDRAGDQGLMVVVEPRDAAGRIVDAPAEVNVAVLDPAMQGEAARVARWNFTAAETAALFRRTGSGGAMHLAMGWPATPPKHNKLHLFVRYITADGRALQAEQPIEIALPGEKPARWTATETPRSADPPVERAPASRSWRTGESASTRAAEATPYMATRTSETRPERPVWSPERR